MWNSRSYRSACKKSQPGPAQTCFLSPRPRAFRSIPARSRWTSPVLRGPCGHRDRFQRRFALIDSGGDSPRSMPAEICRRATVRADSRDSGHPRSPADSGAPRDGRPSKWSLRNPPPPPFPSLPSNHQASRVARPRPSKLSRRILEPPPPLVSPAGPRRDGRPSNLRHGIPPSVGWAAEPAGLRRAPAPCTGCWAAGLEALRHALSAGRALLYSAICTGRHAAGDGFRAEWPAPRSGRIATGRLGPSRSRGPVVLTAS